MAKMSPSSLLARVLAELYSLEFRTLYNSCSPTVLLKELAERKIEPVMTPLQARLADLLPGDKLALSIGWWSPTLPTNFIPMQRGDDGLYRVASSFMQTGSSPRNAYVCYWGPETPISIEDTFTAETRILPYSNIGAALTPGVDRILNDREARLQMTYCSHQLHILGHQAKGGGLKVSFKSGTATFKVEVAPGSLVQPGRVTLGRTYEAGSSKDIKATRFVVAGARGKDECRDIAPYGLLLGLSLDGLAVDGVKLMPDPLTDSGEVNLMLEWLLYGRYLPYIAIVDPRDKKPDRMRLVFPLVHEGSLELGYKIMADNDKYPAMLLRKFKDTDEIVIGKCNDAWMEAMRPYVYADGMDDPSNWRKEFLSNPFTVYATWAKKRTNLEEQRLEIIEYYKRRNIRIQ